MSFRKLQKGFSLIELMVVVAVMGIMLTWAIPNFGPMMRNYELRSAVDRINNSIGWARAEAIRHQKFVMIAPIDAWKGGWKICANSTDLTTCTGATDQLKTEDGLSKTITASITGTSSVIIINPSGMFMTTDMMISLSNGGKTTELSVSMNRVIIK